jgi:hypothetical protein
MIAPRHSKSARLSISLSKPSFPHRRLCPAGGSMLFCLITNSPFVSTRVATYLHSAWDKQRPVAANDPRRELKTPAYLQRQYYDDLP